jgi:hypothetical protein
VQSSIGKIPEVSNPEAVEFSVSHRSQRGIYTIDHVVVRVSANSVFEGFRSNWL